MTYDAWNAGKFSLDVSRAALSKASTELKEDQG